MDAVEYLEQREKFCIWHIENNFCSVNRNHKGYYCPFWRKSAKKPYCGIKDCENIWAKESVENVERWTNGQLTNKE